MSENIADGFLSRLIHLLLSLDDTPALRASVDRVFSTFMHGKTGEFECDRFIEVFGLNNRVDFDPSRISSAIQALRGYASGKYDLGVTIEKLESDSSATSEEPAESAPEDSSDSESESEDESNFYPALPLPSDSEE